MGGALVSLSVCSQALVAATLGAETRRKEVELLVGWVDGPLQA